MNSHTSKEYPFTVKYLYHFSSIYIILERPHQTPIMHIIIILNLPKLGKTLFALQSVPDGIGFTIYTCILLYIHNFVWK